MSVEKTCLCEAGHLVLRSPKYWQLIFKIYISSLTRALPAKVFRAAYFFCRNIDDVLDGDRQISSDPEDYVQSILSGMENKNGCETPQILELYRFAVSHLVNMARTDENPEEYFRRVIKDAMLFDYERARQRRVLTREELEKYYDDTFTPVMDLALIIAGSSSRSADLPESVETQGHIYTIRDLEQDLAQGIINIPAEELAKSMRAHGASAQRGEKSGFASFEPKRALSIDLRRPFGKREVIANPHLAGWVKSEVEIHHAKLEKWKQRLADKGAEKVCRPLILQMDIFCKLHKLGLH